MECSLSSPGNVQTTAVVETSSEVSGHLNQAVSSVLKSCGLLSREVQYFVDMAVASEMASNEVTGQECGANCSAHNPSLCQGSCASSHRQKLFQQREALGEHFGAYGCTGEAAAGAIDHLLGIAGSPKTFPDMSAAAVFAASSSYGSLAGAPRSSLLRHLPRASSASTHVASAHRGSTRTWPLGLVAGRVHAVSSEALGVLRSGPPRYLVAPTSGAVRTPDDLAARYKAAFEHRALTRHEVGWLSRVLAPAATSWTSE